MTSPNNDSNTSDVVSNTKHDIDTSTVDNEKANTDTENNTLPLLAFSHIVSYMPSAVPLAFVAAHPSLRTAAERSENKHGIRIRDFCVLPVNRSRMQYKLYRTRSMRYNANITIPVENDVVRSRGQHRSEQSLHLEKHVQQRKRKNEQEDGSSTISTLERNYSTSPLYALASLETDKNISGNESMKTDNNNTCNVEENVVASNTELPLHKPHSERSLKSLSSFSGSSTASMQSYWESSHYSHSFANLYCAIELNEPQFGGSADHYYPAIGEECIESINNEPCYCTKEDVHATSITHNTFNYNRNTNIYSYHNNNNDNNVGNSYSYTNRSGEEESNAVHTSANTSENNQYTSENYVNFNNEWHDDSSHMCQHNFVTSFPYEPCYYSHGYYDGCTEHITHASTSLNKSQTITERRLAPHLLTCSHSCDHELNLCAAVECSSTFSLNVALHATWWLSRYYGISLRLTGMTPHQLPLFEQLRSKMLLKELILVDCVLNEEWMQCISSCTELISLTLYSCTASHKNVVLHKVHSILSRPQSPLVVIAHATNTLATSVAISETKGTETHKEQLHLQEEEAKAALQPKEEYCEEMSTTSSSSSEENKIEKTPLVHNKSTQEQKEAESSGIYCNATSQFVVGACALGRLSRLRHVHLIDTPVLPLFFEYITQCPLVECVLLHKVKEVEEHVYNLALLPKLETLSLHSLSLTDEVASILFRSLHSLKFLAIDACWRLYDFTFLCVLAHSLRRVILSRCWCDDSGIKSLGECVNLTQLQLHSLKRVKHLEPLSSLTLLERLSISDLSFHDATDNAHDTNYVSHDIYHSHVNLSSANVLNRVTSNMRYLRYCNFVQCKCNRMAPLQDTSTIVGITNLQVREQPSIAETSNYNNNTTTNANITNIKSKTVNENNKNNIYNLSENDNLNILVSLDFSHTSHSAFANDACQLLTRCSQLRYLNLAGCHVSGLLHTLATTSPSSSLRWLNLSETSVTSSALTKCLFTLQNIRCLLLNHCPHIDSLTFAQHYHSLRFLEIADNTLRGNINEELCALSHYCKKLVYLNVRQCVYFTDTSFVRRLRYLRELDLSYTSITQESIMELGQCHYLEVLNISHCTHVHHLHSLMQIASLRVLTANYLELHDSDLVLPNLEQKEQDYEKEDRHVYSRIVSSKSQLRVLNLHKCVFVDSNSTKNKESSSINSSSNGNCRTILSSLLECCALTLHTLDISYCSNLKTFNLHTPLYMLHTLNAAHTALDNEALINIGQCTHLRNVCLFACPNITETSGLSSLKELTALNLSYTNITDNGIKPLSQCTLLSELYLTECHFIHDINCLSSLHYLTCVHAENTALNTKGISKLTQCTSLEELYFTKCSLLTSVKALREALHKLRVLDVYGTAVDDRVAGQPAASPCTIM